MKVADIRRKLMAALAAGGLLSPAAALAADLNTNLVVNPGFENVDFNVIGSSIGPLILDWTNNGFTYSHDGNGGVQDFANGDPLGTGGSFYFYPGATGDGGPAHHSLETAITQTIDVSTGPAATLIASGNAKYGLSAYFSSYSTQADYGIVQVDFLNNASAVLGSGQVTPGPGALEQWTQFIAGGSVPAGTTSVKVSSWGVLLAGGGSDGYTDNIDFQISTGLPALSIEVNRSTGAVTLSNLTGSAKNLSGYTIASAFEAVNPTNWLSIADNYDNGNAGPNQVDPAHAWSETSSTFGEATESEPTLAGASLAAGRTVNLGTLWTINPTEDLTFNYISGGETVQGLVTYVGGPGGAALAEGDLNVDGAINAADWMILRNNQLADLSGVGLAQAYRRGDLNGDLKNDHADFTEFKALFDGANGVGAFAAMAAAVPEPASCVMVLAAGAMLLPVRRRGGSGTRSFPNSSSERP